VFYALPTLERKAMGCGWFESNESTLVFWRSGRADATYLPVLEVASQSFAPQIALLYEQIKVIWRKKKPLSS
jgi:hypothetical protein